MPAPYYGDPEVVRLYNRNVKSLVDTGDFEAQIDLYDSVATARMLSDLAGVFSSVPAPNSKMQNVLAVLWVYAMTDEIQPTKGSTARTQATGYQEAVEDRYSKLLREIKSGEKLVPGAVRISTTPQISQYTSERVRPMDYDNPIVIADQFPHGLRTGPGGATGPMRR